MKKKPSEAIWKIYERICKEHKVAVHSEFSVDYQYLSHAIMEFLDKQYEK